MRKTVVPNIIRNKKTSGSIRNKKHGTAHNHNTTTTKVKKKGKNEEQ
jgi:hypothetical protein